MAVELLYFAFFVLFAFLLNILTVFLFLFFLILSMRIRNHGEYKKSDHHRRGVFIFPFKEENKTAHSGAENSRCAVRFFPFWLATTRTDRKGTQKCCSSFLFCASSSSSSISVIRSDWETLKQLYRFGKERKRQDAHPRPRTWDFHTLMPGRTHGQTPGFYKFKTREYPFPVSFHKRFELVDATKKKKKKKKTNIQGEAGEFGGTPRISTPRHGVPAEMRAGARTPPQKSCGGGRSGSEVSPSYSSAPPTVMNWLFPFL